MTTNLRPDLAAHLRQRLQAFADGFRHNLALIGPPGSGKTFQLQHAVADRPSQLLAISCCLYRESARSFLQRLLCAILQAGLTELHLTLERERPGSLEGHAQRLDALLKGAEHHIPRTAAAARSLEGLLLRRVDGEALQRTLDLIPLLGDERRQPCVFILDEFLYVEDLGFSQAFHELGKRVMTWPSTLFILSSSSVYRARMILRERLQLLFGQFELLTLETLNPHTVAAWATEELADITGVQMISPFLMGWLGTHPWYLTVFLKRLKELSTLTQSPALTELLFFQTAWDLLGSPEGVLHQWCRSRVEALPEGRRGARALEALLQMADGARTMTEIGRPIGRSGLTEALHVLMERDLAQRHGACWVIPDPILRCWLSTVLREERCGAAVPDAASRRRFEDALRQLWHRWAEAHQRSFPEQVIGLFEQFADETVLLDAKTGRLPKFHTITQQPADRAGASSYLVADGEGKRWCATIQEHSMDENGVAHFEAFCRRQSPRPSRKVVITNTALDQNARLLAKAVNMWVWESSDLRLLMELFGR